MTTQIKSSKGGGGGSVLYATSFLKFISICRIPRLGIYRVSVNNRAVPKLVGSLLPFSLESQRNEQDAIWQAQKRAYRHHRAGPYEHTLSKTGDSIHCSGDQNRKE